MNDGGYSQPIRNSRAAPVVIGLRISGAVLIPRGLRYGGILDRRRLDGTRVDIVRRLTEGATRPLLPFEGRAYPQP